MDDEGKVAVVGADGDSDGFAVLSAWLDFGGGGGGDIGGGDGRESNDARNLRCVTGDFARA